MPVILGGRLVSFHEPLRTMSNAMLRDYANALRPFMRTNPITVERKIRDIESELEWRRAAHTKEKGRP